MSATDIRRFIHDVPDFPKPGILFRDITPLLGDGAAFDATIAQLDAATRPMNASRVLGVESRGFIFGAALAARRGVGFIPVRKPKKLPRAVVAETYALEYGTDTLEMHADALRGGERILIVDDVLATGGTAAAVGKLVEQARGSIAGYAFVIELDFLNGRSKLGGTDVASLVHY